MQIKKFFDAAGEILRHNNITAKKLCRKITRVEYLQNHTAPTIVHTCQDLNELITIRTHFQMADTNLPSLSQQQMLHRYLELLADHELRGCYPKNEKMTFLPTNPITILHTPGITRSDLKDYCIKLAKVAEQHHKSVLHPWQLEFLDNGQAQIVHTNYPIVLEIVEYCTQQSVNTFKLQYPYSNKYFEQVSATVTIDKANPLINSNEITINSMDNTRVQLTRVCVNYQQNSNLQVQQLANFSLTLLKGPNFLTCCNTISQICQRLTEKEKENTLSLELQNIIRTYNTVSQIQYSPQSTTPILECDDQAIEFLLHEYTIPMMTIISSLPSVKIPHNAILKNFILVELLRFELLQQQLKVLIREINQKKSISEYEHPIVEHLHPILCSMSKILLDRMFYQECIILCELTLQIAQIFVLKSANNKYSHLKEALIFLEQYQAQAALSTGDVKQCEAALNRMELSIGSSEKKFEHLGRCKMVRIEMAIANGNLTTANTLLTEFEQYVEYSKKTIIPSLVKSYKQSFIYAGSIEHEQHYEPILQYIRLVQRFRFDAYFVKYYLALHYYFDGDIESAIKIVDRCISSPISVYAEDFVAHFNLQISKAGIKGAELNLENATGSHQLEVLQIFLNLKASVANAKYLEFLELVHHIDANNNVIFNLDFSNNIVEIGVSNSETTKLTDALSKSSINYKLKKGKINSTFTLCEFEHINLSHLVDALRSIFTISIKPAVPQKVAPTHFQESLANMLKIRAFKDIAKGHFSQLEWHINLALEQAEISNSCEYKAYYYSFAITLLCLQAQQYLAEFDDKVSVNTLKAAKELHTKLCSLKEAPKSSKIISAQKISWSKLIIRHTATSTCINQIKSEFDKISDQCDIDALFKNFTGQSAKKVLKSLQSANLLNNELKPKIKAISTNIGFNAKKLQHRIQSWLIVSTGKLYLTKIYNLHAVSEETELLKSIMNNVKRDIESDNNIICAYFELAKLVTQLQQCKEEQKDKLYKNTQAAFSKLNCVQTNLYFFNLSINLLAQSEISSSTLLTACSNSQTVIEHQDNNALRQIIQQTSWLTLLIYQIRIALEKSHLNEDCTNTYQRLHFAQVSLRELIQENHKIIQTNQLLKQLQSIIEHTLICSFQIASELIIPKFCRNGRLCALLKSPVNPYNWYCLVKYDFYPHENAKEIFTLLEKCHEINQYQRVSEQDLQLLLLCYRNEANNIALLYSIGKLQLRIHNKNPTGVTYIKEAYTQNHPQAGYALGKIYWFGLGGEIEDRAKAVTFFTQAAKQHEYYLAYYRLAKHYQHVGNDDLQLYYGQRAVDTCPHDEETKQRVARRFQVDYHEEKKAPANSEGQAIQKTN